MNLTISLFFLCFLQLRLQFICLIIGIWSLRNVRRQRVYSASLFDQRRMRLQGSAVNGRSNTISNVDYSSRQRTKSTDSVELTQQQQQRQQIGFGKVPKSPAPGQDSNLQTV